MYRVNQAEYVIHMRVAAPQEYVNTYATSRVLVCVCGQESVRVSIRGQLVVKVGTK